MAYIIRIKNIIDPRGKMGIIDSPQDLPFKIRRVLYMSEITGTRGGHAHKKTIQGLICLKGKCEIYTNNGQERKIFQLSSPEKCLILNPEDWHTMQKFSEDAILLVLGSEYYNPEDYIKEESKND